MHTPNMNLHFLFSRIPAFNALLRWARDRADTRNTKQTWPTMPSSNVLPHCFHWLLDTAVSQFTLTLDPSPLPHVCGTEQHWVSPAPFCPFASQQNLIPEMNHPWWKILLCTIWRWSRITKEGKCRLNLMEFSSFSFHEPLAKKVLRFKTDRLLSSKMCISTWGWNMSSTENAKYYLYYNFKKGGKSENLDNFTVTYTVFPIRKKNTTFKFLQVWCQHWWEEEDNAPFHKFPPCSHRSPGAHRL